MDRKKWLTVAFLLALLIWVVLLNLPKENKFELDIDPNAFALVQPEKITRVRVNYSDQTAVLEKWGSHWLINGMVKAEPTYVQKMLSLASKLTLKRAWTSKDNSNESDFAHISFFEGENLRLEYFLKKEGLSVVKKTKAAKSYLAEIPGFSDSFGSFFTPNELSWKTNLVFNSSLRTLNKLEVKNFKDPRFNLNAKYRDGFFEFEGLAQPDTQKVGVYLSQFREVRYDYGLNDSLKTQARKLLSSQKPLLSIEVADIDSTKNNYLMVFELNENKRFYLGTTKTVRDTFLISKKTITNLTPSLNQLSKTTP